MYFGHKTPYNSKVYCTVKFILNLTILVLANELSKEHQENSCSTDVQHKRQYQVKLFLLDVL